MEILIHSDTDVDMCKDAIIYGLKTFKILFEDRFYGTFAVKTVFRRYLTDSDMDVGRFLIRKRNGEILSLRAPYRKDHMYISTEDYYGCIFIYVDIIKPELNEHREIAIMAQYIDGGKYFSSYDVDLDNNTITRGG